jgi:hypothetical protein
MNPETVLILDRAFTYAIFCFLIAFVVLLLYARSKLRRRSRKLGDLYIAEFQDQSAAREEAIRSLLSPWQIVLRAFFASLICALVFLGVYLFTPVPFFRNFAVENSWRITPLRLTAISYDRAYEGFSLEGEVWNQTQEPMPGVQASIKVMALDDKPLDEIEVDVAPDPLPAGRSGSFRVRYSENSPFIKGYSVSFLDQEGRHIPHVTGFDVP